MAIEVGKKAPAFTLAGSDGKKHSLKEYAGKTVVLYFYPRDNTPGCTKEACGFRDLQPEFNDLDAVVLGVSKDSLDSHDRFIEQFDLPFVLLSDPETKVMQKYGAYGEKMHYGKLITGTTRTTTIIGPDGKVSKHWKKVPKAEAHPQKVLEFLKEQA
ncbi:peroxiredoxin [Tichowtungia aerotolerans]|uniref:thioredoxin-dependent peroxiredoxin n=1 Tax=Tichowtungia aerotolerans TaxID=2697043 RepID=A0A6P1MD24_9BACT|nr:peroxiredoxin [Tichowtungia aerotolerans]QHI69968.1 redoxin domain-containing protein [Tichowtungia aerotolerans]